MGPKEFLLYASFSGSHSCRENGDDWEGICVQGGAKKQEVFMIK